MERINITLAPEQYHQPEELRLAVARHMHLSKTQIAHVKVIKRSLDSRRGVKYQATVEVYLSGEIYQPEDFSGAYRDCSEAPQVLIVGAGPAGLFAALKCLESGLKPVILERGKPVEERKRDIALLGRTGEVNPQSNWCFGEGGAGTFSDGKLYTRSTKRGDVNEVLRHFVEHGADPDILIDAHAHIGTDRLSPIIARMRETILKYGGEIHFQEQVVDFIQSAQGVEGVITLSGKEFRGIAVILATGHSARDIYELFSHRGWLLEAKPFALGVRVEHPQALINSIQYHSPNYSKYLPPAAYSLTTQACGHGVFSFCMCPGGCIVPAATAAEQQVVNGMSNAQRNSPFANSGIAVTVSPEDVPEFSSHGPLALLHFQQEVEKRMFQACHGGESSFHSIAPTQRLVDFLKEKPSSRLNKTNYLGQTSAAPLHELLPSFITRSLQQGFRDFDRKMRGFITEEASLLAVESRTSSPVRIPRDATLQHPQLHRLYPCGEGAGYAGGIVSSALDGINIVRQIAATNGRE